MAEMYRGRCLGLEPVEERFADCSLYVWLGSLEYGLVEYAIYSLDGRYLMLGTQAKWGTQPEKAVGAPASPGYAPCLFCRWVRP